MTVYRLCDRLRRMSVLKKYATSGSLALQCNITGKVGNDVRISLAIVSFTTFNNYDI